MGDMLLWAAVGTLFVVGISSDGTMARILVIDNEEDVRRVVDVMLNAGHDTVLAVDGNDGLRQFKQQHFDLVTWN